MKIIQLIHCFLLVVHLSFCNINNLTNIFDIVVTANSSEYKSENYFHDNMRLFLLFLTDIHSTTHLLAVTVVITTLVSQPLNCGFQYIIIFITIDNCTFKVSLKS